MNVRGKELAHRRGAWDALGAFLRRMTVGFGSSDARQDARDLECVELKVQLAHGDAPDENAEQILRQLRLLPHVASEPAPEVKVHQYNLSGTVLNLRVFCQRRHYWRVFMSLGEVSSQFGSPIVRPRIRGI